MKKFFFLIFTILTALSAQAQGVKPLPTLHVEGRWLVDNHGNHVVLHGVMDTPNTYFNGGRWQGSKAQGWWDDYNATGVKNCLAYFEKLFVGMEKAKCTVFRLHLDPAWTNDPNKTQVGEGGEHNISQFSSARLKSFLTSLYWPLIQKAMNHGMYVVVRPPGVCPGNLQVGDEYNQYLMTVWDIFSNNTNIKKYAGQISIELANEPVSLKNAQGQDDAKALHDFFQPIVDKIRDNGFTGIIWAPGTGWQSSYADYAAHPIEGYNIGYAVHDYCGWYGCDDAHPSSENKINQFHKQVPVVDFAPVIITEVDWSPENPDAQGHYNEHGDWVQPNYGTWATGSTSKWGKAFKDCLDHFGNISMTLSGTGCLFDIDTLIKNNKVVPAFNGLEEACGKACMDWYADYYQVDWPHADDEPQSVESTTMTTLSVPDESIDIMVGGTAVINLTATFQDGHTRDVTALADYEVSAPGVLKVDNGRLVALAEGIAQVTATYTDPQGNKQTVTFSIRSSFFPFASQYISTSLFSQGTYDASTRTFKPGQYGQMGWEYSGGADMSAYKYLVLKLKNTASGAHLNIFTAGSIWSDCCATPDFGSKKQIVVNLKTAKYTSGDKTGQAVDTKNIRIVSFWSNYGSIVVDDMYLTNNSDYSREDATAIQEVVNGGALIQTPIYDLGGRRIDTPNAIRSGIYIQNGRKIIRK